MTAGDIIRSDDQVLSRLGDPPTPVPQPFAEVLTRYLDNRLNLTTASGATNPFLFPGRRTRQPLHTTSLRLRPRNLGLSNLDGRTARHPPACPRRTRPGHRRNARLHQGLSCACLAQALHRHQTHATGKPSTPETRVSADRLQFTPPC